MFCHKPCTVSGGGKSEISKSLGDYILYGPIFVADLEKDLDLVQQLFDHDYADRWKPGRGPDYSRRPSRPLLSPLRSLGSVIKLLTPSDDYTRSTTPGWRRSRPHLPAGLPHQALPPARGAGRAGASSSASTRSTAGRATS